MSEPIDPVATHLEYFAYEVESTPDGWSRVTHPRRYNFFYKRFPYGLRLHCAILLGPLPGDVRPSFVDAVNAINEKSVMVKFSLSCDADGDYGIRARAIFQSDYEKKAFGMFMDIWHVDLELVSELPKVPEVEQEPESTKGQTAVVH